MMRCFVFLFLIFNSFYIYAQDTHALDFKPKEIWLEGQIGYNGFESRLPDYDGSLPLANTDARGYAGDISLQANYFLTRKFSVGVGGAFALEDFKYPTENYKFNSRSFAAKGSLRYYILNFTEGLKLYGEVAPEFRSTSYKIDHDDVKSDGDFQNFNTAFNLGVTYFIREYMTVSVVFVDNVVYQYQLNNEEGELLFNPNIFQNFINWPTFSIMWRL